MAKIKLKAEDWKNLLPQTDYKLGNTTLPLRPLNVSEVGKIARVAKNMAQYMKDKGITLDNFKDPANIGIVFEIILDVCPELISDSANLDVEDVRNLPLEVGIDLFNKLIEVNLKSKDALEKNSLNLANTIKSLSGRKKKVGK